MIVPLALLDLWIEFYQATVFPLLGIPRVPRSAHLRVIDREKLPYLSPVQKVACAYCGYANGLLRYAAAIAANTERHFCPIKHKPDPGFIVPDHQGTFAPYGDEEAFRALDRQSLPPGGWRDYRPR